MLLGTIGLLFSSSTITACFSEADKEKSFNENFGTNIIIPYDEDDFVKKLKELNLSVRVAQITDDRGRYRIRCLSPKQWKNVDLSQAFRCYRITDDIGSTPSERKEWIAYANRNRKIFYIMNNYSYTFP